MALPWGCLQDMWRKHEWNQTLATHRCSKSQEEKVQGNPVSYVIAKIGIFFKNWTEYKNVNHLTEKLKCNQVIVIHLNKFVFQKIVQGKQHLIKYVI